MNILPWDWVWFSGWLSSWGGGGCDCDCACCWVADALSWSSVIFKYSSEVYALFEDGEPSADLDKWKWFCRKFYQHHEWKAAQFGYASMN